MKHFGKVLFVIITIGMIMIAAWYFIKVPPLKVPPEKIIENYKKESYSGVVLDKYIDEQQHGYHKVILKEENGQRVILFDDETGGVFDYIKKDDTLRKLSGSLKVQLTRKNLDTLISMSFFGDNKYYPN